MCKCLVFLKVMTCYFKLIFSFLLKKERRRRARWGQTVSVPQVGMVHHLYRVLRAILVLWNEKYYYSIKHRRVKVYLLCVSSSSSGVGSLFQASFEFWPECLHVTVPRFHCDLLLHPCFGCHNSRFLRGQIQDHFLHLHHLRAWTNHPHDRGHRRYWKRQWRHWRLTSWVSVEKNQLY